MTRSYGLTRLAEEELDSIADYIARSSPASGARFYRAAIATFDWLVRFPETGVTIDHSRPAFGVVRVQRIRDFGNFLAFYRIVDEQIEILRVVHGSRNRDRIIKEL